MFNLSGALSNVLNNLDNVAKETLEEPKLSATQIRKQKQLLNNNGSNPSLAIPSNDSISTSSNNNNNNNNNNMTQSDDQGEVDKVNK